MKDPAISNLIGGQQLGYAAGGIFIAWSFASYGLTTNVLIPLMFSCLFILITWIGVQVIHELMEINDQLAGRSPEFHRQLRAGQK